MRINIQPIEKSRTNNTFLEVHSVFYTIQGEGPFCGQPAVFVRLAGCNLQCPGCDTDYTSAREVMLPHEVHAAIREASRKEPLPPFHQRFLPLVVITGGEPFRQDIGKLVTFLLSKGYRVQIETNGTLYRELPFIDPNLTIVCSPKAGKVNAQLAPHINAYKYVMHADAVDLDDGLPVLALGHSAAPRVARPHEGYRGPIYLQPMDCNNGVQNELNLSACIDSCMQFGYTLQLQIHKIIDME